MTTDDWLNSEHERFNVDLYYQHALVLLLLILTRCKYILLENNKNSACKRSC